MASARNTSRRTHTRRAVVGGAAGVAASGVLAQSLAARKAPALIQGGTSLTYWGGLIFSDDANQLLVDTINQWGADNNVDTEVVMINQNETNQRVSAAVESNTMPSALDLGLDLALLLSQSDQLLDVSDTYAAIGDAHGGWHDSVAGAVLPEKFNAIQAGVPFGAGGNVLFRRLDVLEEAGLTEPPATWQELSDQGAQAQQPGVYGLGLALSNVGDANLMVSVLQSYGGRIADDEGRTCTITSDETVEFLEWVKAAWDAGLFPPGATTWDGAGDNTAYLSGQAVFIANTGSVSIAAANDDPELFEATGYSALPAGPVMTVAPIGVNLRAIPVNNPDPDTAKALIEYLAQPEFIGEYFKVAIYGPVLNGQDDMDAFTQTAVLTGLKDLVLNGTAPGEPDVSNTAYADFNSNFTVPKMIQRIVVDGLSIEDALAEAQQVGDDIYAKYD